MHSWIAKSFVQKTLGILPNERGKGGRRRVCSNEKLPGRNDGPTVC